MRFVIVKIDKYHHYESNVAKNVSIDLTEACFKLADVLGRDTPLGFLEIFEFPLILKLEVYIPHIGD